MFAKYFFSVLLLLFLLVQPSIAAEYIGDKVWHDTNANGIQDAGEPGVAGVTVNITGANVTYNGTTTTDANGNWQSGDLRSRKNYTVTFVLPAGYLFSPQDQGGDDDLDSDANTSTGTTGIITAVRNATLTHIDAGIYLPAEIDIQGNGTSIPDGDTTPSTGDDTGFGSIVAVSGAVSKTFTILNLGDLDLTLSGSPLVNISGSHASDFTVTSQPGATITGGNNTTFIIQFDPSDLGLRSATVTIASDDSDENPYTFDIQGTGLGLPEIDVAGNSISIFDGDTSPSVNDDTYFGSTDIVTGTVDHTFTISNLGNEVLYLTGSPVVAISGTHAAEFLVTSQPGSSIAASGSDTFVIQFDPSASGMRSATVSIASDDGDENPYTFNIQGTGSATPEIDISGSGLSISDGSTSVSVLNDTDFGNTDISYGSTVHTFTISNIGSGDLSLSNFPAVVAVSGAHASDFTVTQQPASATVTSQGGTQTFQITFNPPSTGLRQASVSITSNDADESPYTFSIQGTGTINPEISIEGSTVEIVSGDDTPSATDSTAFGSVDVGATSRIVTYTILNTGPAQLNLTGAWPLVSITGSHAGDFSVHTAPSSIIAAGGSTTFQIAFNPLTSGTRSASLTIANNDLDESSYTFDIEGTGVGGVSNTEIDVQGNLASIISGDTSPSELDGTHLGVVAVTSGSLSQTFTINNTGSQDLILTSSPLVSVSGVHASDFSITQQPSTPVAPAGSVPFIVTFNPSGAGSRTAVISIENNDTDENPYTFTVEGFGLTYPEIEIRGNGLTIENADASPSMLDSTYFGDVTASLGHQHVTYTIYNTGDSTLTLTGSPLVALIGDADTEFTVTDMPASTILPGGSSEFSVQFDPAQVGLRNIAVSITSNDDDENPYVYAIQGNGTGPGSPLACVPNFFHIFGDEGTITYLDGTTNPYSYTTIAVAGYAINGAGYNLEDGLLYAFEMDTDVPGDNLIRIDGTGTISVLSSVSIPYLSWRADFDNSGDMYFWNAGGDDISVFDASAGAVVSSTPTTGVTWLPIDMAYLNSDGKFYGIHTDLLYKFDPLTNIVSTITITGRLSDEYATAVNSAYYGASWSANDGYLYSTNSQSGRMYKINVNTGESVYVGQAEANLNKSDGASCPLAEAPLPSTGSVGNKVWVDNDMDGVQDAGEAGLAGVTVSLYGIDNPFIASTTTDANGEYTFHNLAPSEYYIIFSGAPAGFSLTSQDQGGDDVSDSDADPATGQTADFFVGVGSIEEGMDAGYISTGVGDFIWDDVNNNGDQDFGEVGIPGVTVELVLVSNGSTVATTTSDANGFYFFTNVSATTYQIRVSNLPGGYIFTTQNGATDDIDSDVNTSTGLSDQFTLTPGNFNGTVDAGLYQQTEPEINITGNGNTIPDGDTSPAISDDTDFGSISAASGTIVHTFTVENVTGADLTLNGSPSVSISGVNASDFSVTASPAATITSGNSTTFQITFDPSGDGLRSAIVSISNNDSDENPYDFDIQGTGLAPEITLQGNGQNIVSGSTTPTTTNATDFGNHDIDTGSISTVFTIQNTGGANLSLTGSSPYIAISGTHASDFSITVNPVTPITPSGSTTFTIHFDPSAAGVRTATLSIANSDTDEDPFTFDIQGTGTTVPEIAVQGNLVDISDGDTSPSIADDTDFGSRDIFETPIVHTFTILNPGSGDLSLTGMPVVQISGSNAGDFIVTQQPTGSTVTPAGSITFQVGFDPTTTGNRQATISISNDDSDENPFTFAVTGLGTSTLDEEIEVLGNGIVIESGDSFPMESDNTELGTAEISGIPATAQFVIRNIGYATLNLTGPPPYVDLTGVNASEFTITSSPSNVIAIDSATTSFEVTFTPAALGTRQAYISIQNDDSDENPYTFKIQGTGIYDPISQSEINIQGNMIDIPDGDGTPAVNDGTDFGSVEVVGGFTEAQEFVVHNIGSDDLVLGDNPIIEISGANAGDFTVTAVPASLVAPASTVAFTITFDPSGTGLRTATVSIDNSDLTESPYTFAIQGTGTTASEISISGNGSTISTGDTSPSTLDSTYFGDVDVSLGNRMVTYTINNNGSAPLTFTGSKVAISGSNSSDFYVSSYPASSVAVGGNTSFVIEFDPLVVGARTATISVTSNDPDTPTYTFNVQGYGTGAGSPLACAPNFYQVYGSSGTIAYLDASTSPYTYTTVASAGYTIDGIGYNQQDGLIYGFEQDLTVAGDRLVRIDASGDVTVLTSISIPYASTRADFDDQGDLYFWNSAGDNLSRFDASTGTVTSNLNPGGADFLAQDMAFRSSDGLFYGVNGSTLYIYNPGSNSVSTEAVQGKLSDDLIAGTNGNAFGATWTASDGYVYVANNTSGRMYKVNVSTNPVESIYVGQSLATSNSDGASCAVAASPLPTSGSIGDLVWLDSDGDGIQDAGESGLAGVTVSLYVSDGTPVGTAVTAADGLYSFGSLGAGEYYLTFTTPPAGFSLTTKTAGTNDGLDSDPDPATLKTDNIEITPGVVNSSIDAGFKATGVGDFVWLDIDEDGIQDPGENGVPGINVEIKTDPAGVSMGTTTTDASGKYIFTGLSAATYRLYFTNLPAGYAFSLQNQGADDALDSDVDAGNGQSDVFTLSTGVYNSTVDVGVYQLSVPEIDVTGNYRSIPSGDTSPQTLDYTDFGDVDAGTGSLARIFMVHNGVGTDLTLNGTPKVVVSGTHASEFVLTTAPATLVSSGDSTAFEITFSPAAEGLRTATLSIANTDPDEGPYTFDVRGFGLASEIQVEGNSQIIVDGSTTPTASNYTDFGSEDILTGSQAQIFSILNSGNANLTLSDAPDFIVISGDHAADFSVTSAPTSPVATNNSTTFTITFNPEAEGLRSATISIANNDLDENPFTFAIQGIGLASPEITVAANGQLIADGDLTPSVSDSTEFGSKDILSDTQVNTFKIINTGSGDLTLTGNPFVILTGAHAGDFLINSQPAASTVPAGDSLAFEVTFDPTAVGLRSASISIASDDEDENPFNFNIQGTGVASSEINVTGNGVSIVSGDLTPGLTDSTLFTATILDSTSHVSYIIENPGSAILTLTNPEPYITISGTNSSDFTLSQTPSATIAAGGGTTGFTIRFVPSEEGMRTALVSIASDDSDENPYTFAIQGEGLPTPPPVLTLVESVDLTVAAPGDTLTYTVVYSNVGAGLATSVVVDQSIPDNSTYVENSASGVGMTISYSHDNAGSYDTSQAAPVTDIKFQKEGTLVAGGNGTITFRVVVD